MAKQSLEELEKEIEDMEKGTPSEEESQEEVTEQTTESLKEESAKGESSETTSSEETEDSGKKLSAEEESFKKRYGDLRRHNDKQTKDLQARIDMLEKGSSGEGIAAPASDEDIDEWVKSNPEIASIVNSIAERQATAKFQEADKNFEDINSERETLKREKAEANILKSHSDFISIREDDAFHSWAATQSKLVQTALYDDPDDYSSVIRAIDLYKMDTAEPKKETKKNLGAAEAVDNKTSSSSPKETTNAKWSESRVDALSMEDYIKYEEEIDKDKSAGNFIYDLT